MSNDSQKVRDILGWAQNMPEAVIAMMALTDLVGDLEKRLTALEAAKPDDSNPWVAVAIAAHESKAAAADVKRLNESLYASRLDREALQEEIDALEAQRNMLAAQVDDLRNVNAGLRAALGTAADKIRRLTEGFYALEAQRNALAAQVDDLRNVNAALRIALSDPAPCTGTGSGGCDCLPDDEA